MQEALYPRALTTTPPFNRRYRRARAKEQRSAEYRARERHRAFLVARSLKEIDGLAVVT